MKVTIADEMGDSLYTWTIDGKQIHRAGQRTKEMNLAVTVKPASSDTAIRALLAKDKGFGKARIISMGQKDNFTTGMQVSVNLNQEGTYQAGDKAYVYHYNMDTKKLDSLPKTACRVDGNGFLNLDVKYGEKYVVLPAKADPAIKTTLINQVSVAKNTTVQRGKTTRIKTELPAALKKTASFQGDDLSKVG